MTRSFSSYAVVPAAGHSRRMGQSKLRLPWQGRPLLEHTLLAWHRSGVTAIVVVVRSDDAELAAIVRKTSARLVIPSRDPRDMKESVRCALEAIAQQHRPGAADVWLLAPADMPAISPASIQRLLGAHRPAQPAILVPRYDSKRGHPVLFPWSLASEVSHLPANEGVNALLHQHPVREIDVPDANVLSDVDTPDDYRRLTNGPSSPSEAVTPDETPCPDRGSSRRPRGSARRQSPGQLP